jgi:hypothetical protein
MIFDGGCSMLTLLVPVGSTNLVVPVTCSADVAGHEAEEVEPPVTC